VAAVDPNKPNKTAQVTRVRPKIDVRKTRKILVKPPVTIELVNINKT
jgi:hypothetical protein